MSYLPPYSAPNPDFDLPPILPPDLLRPARQASMILLILAGVALLGAGMSTLLAMIPVEQWPADQRQRMQQIIEPTGWTLKTYFQATAAMMGTMAVILGTLGILVRGGRRAVIIIALIVNGVLFVLMVKSIVNALSSGEVGSAFPPMLLGAAMLLLSQRLMTALRAARTARTFAMQNWQQFQQPYDAGYGYTNPLPPPPPALAPPPPDDPAKST